MEFGLSIFEYDSLGVVNQEFMKTSLRHFIETQGVKHIISGTRSTDPFTQGLDVFAASDSKNDWPEFQRVLPIYFWSYRQVWEFILENELPYCRLYEDGHTYVGDQSNTITNPFLKGMHAKFGNDNRELFSRKKLFDGLLKVDERVLFNEQNVFLILRDKNKETEFMFKILDKQISDFCLQNGFVFEGKSQNLKTYLVQEKWKKDDVVFEEIVLCRKRKPNNFSRLFMGVSVDVYGESVQFLI